MSQFSIDEIIRSTPGDGGSTPLGLSIHRLDIDDLLKAWKLERGHSIECEILLDLSRATITRLMSMTLNQTPTDRQDAHDLIREIDHRLRHGSPDRP